jgi:hypothetical protein
MLSLTRGRVARRLRILTEIARDKIRSREMARERAAALASISEAVAAAGLDPADNGGLRYYAGADRVLARIGDSERQQRADAAFIAQDPVLAKRRNWLLHATARARDFIGRPPPQPGSSSPFDWHAWSLAFRSELSAVAAAM